MGVTHDEQGECTKGVVRHGTRYFKRKPSQADRPDTTVWAESFRCSDLTKSHEEPTTRRRPRRGGRPARGCDHEDRQGGLAATV